MLEQNLEEGDVVNTLKTRSLKILEFQRLQQESWKSLWSIIHCLGIVHLAHCSSGADYGKLTFREWLIPDA